MNVLRYKHTDNHNRLANSSSLILKAISFCRQKNHIFFFGKALQNQFSFQLTSVAQFVPLSIFCLSCSLSLPSFCCQLLQSAFSTYLFHSFNSGLVEEFLKCTPILPFYAIYNHSLQHIEFALYYDYFAIYTQLSCTIIEIEIPLEPHKSIIFSIKQCPSR